MSESLTDSHLDTDGFSADDTAVDTAAEAPATAEAPAADQVRPQVARWYAVQVASSCEKKVKATLEQRAVTLGVDNRIYEIEIPQTPGVKLKKDGSGQPPTLALAENPDILAGLGHSPAKPRLLVGFAAETQNVIDHARAKLARKGADWIVANDVSGDVMGGPNNTVHIVSAGGVEDLPEMPKEAVARALATRIADALD